MAGCFSNNGLKLHPVSIACRDIAQKVKGGKLFTISCDRWVPYDENSLIASGEETGNLVQAFRDCVRIIEIRQRIGRLIASATVFPSVVWSMMAALLYVIAMWMVPSMAQRSNPGPALRRAELREPLRAGNTDRHGDFYPGLGCHPASVLRAAGHSQQPCVEAATDPALSDIACAS